METTINNNAYLLSCQCPRCKTYLHRKYNEEEFFCWSCGAYLLAPAFTQQEIDDAIFEMELDNYESY